MCIYIYKYTNNCQTSFGKEQIPCNDYKCAKSNYIIIGKKAMNRLTWQLWYKTNLVIMPSISKAPAAVGLSSQLIHHNLEIPVWTIQLNHSGIIVSFVKILAKKNPKLVNHILLFLRDSIPPATKYLCFCRCFNLSAGIQQIPSDLVLFMSCNWGNWGVGWSTWILGRRVF